METVTSEERTDIVNSSFAGDGTVYSSQRIVDVNPNGPVRTTARQTETSTADPYAVPREGTLRVQGFIYFLFGVVEGLIAIRLVLTLLGANPAAGFSRVIHGVTAPFLAPFVGLFGTVHFGGRAFEVNSVVAIFVSALIAWVLARAVELVQGETRSDGRTTSSQFDTQTR